MQDIFRALPKILQMAGELEHLREPMVFAAWKRIAGENLDKHTVAKKLEEKRLIVAVSDDIWRRHLESLSPQMVFRLNNLIGEESVTFIEFRVEGKIFEAMRNKARAEKARLEKFDHTALEELSPELRGVAAEIEDPDLRQSFLQAAGNAMLRKKHRAE